MIDFYGGGSQILPKEYFANEPIHNGVSAPPHTITCTPTCTPRHYLRNHTQRCVYMNARKHKLKHTHIIINDSHKYKHTHIHTHVHTHIHTYAPHTYTNVCVCACTYVCVRVLVCI